MFARLSIRVHVTTRESESLPRTQRRVAAHRVTQQPACSDVHGTVRLGFAAKTPNCDMFILKACNLVSSWSQHEKWPQLGLILVSRWFQHGLSFVSTGERKNLCGLRRCESAINWQLFTRKKQRHVTPLPPREVQCRLNLADVSLPPNDRSLHFV